MAPIGTVQVAGNANAGPLEVELNTLAARMVARPADFVLYGSYGIAPAITGILNSETTSATALANRTLFAAYIPQGQQTIIAIKRVLLSYAQYGTIANAKGVTFNLVRCTGLNDKVYYQATESASAFSGETTFGKTHAEGFGSKLRATMRDPALHCIWPRPNANTNLQLSVFSITASASENSASIITSGITASQIRTKDNQPLSTIEVSLGTTAGTGFSNQELFDYMAHGQPLVLTEGCGIEIQGTTSAAPGTSEVGDLFVTVLWDEYNEQQGW